LELATLINSAPIAIVALGSDGTVRTANPAAERLIGQSEAALSGKMLPLLATPAAPQAKNLRELLRRGKPFANVELQSQRSDGSPVEVMASSAPLFDAQGELRGCIMTLADLSDVRRLERQLIQSQKMEAIGRLTGGMAHDFDNLLGIVIGNLDLLREQLADRDEALGMVESAQAAALKGSALNRQLLAFARRQPLEARAIDPNSVISSMRSLLERTLGESIAVKLKTAPDLWPIRIDPVQLESALLNLAVNARDAMPGGGTLTIETSNYRVDGYDPMVDAELQAGDYAMLACPTPGPVSAPNISR
ncbi:MAG: PAS domain S-box protein, partial [Alphaproteobacteria bacterium]|nr:PAS domain S-box protein [Alphaproteobacteria bacterium]